MCASSFDPTTDSGVLTRCDFMSSPAIGKGCKRMDRSDTSSTDSQERNPKTSNGSEFPL